MAEEFLTSGQVARLLGISPRTARRYLTKGLIPAEQNRLTGRWRVSKTALIWFMKKHGLEPLPSTSSQPPAPQEVPREAGSLVKMPSSGGRRPPAAWSVAEFGIGHRDPKAI